MAASNRRATRALITSHLAHVFHPASQTTKRPAHEAEAKGLSPELSTGRGKARRKWRLPFPPTQKCEDHPFPIPRPASLTFVVERALPHFSASS
jgi:hypothetical protein